VAFGAAAWLLKDVAVWITAETADPDACFAGRGRRFSGIFGADHRARFTGRWAGAAERPSGDSISCELPRSGTSTTRACGAVARTVAATAAAATSATAIATKGLRRREGLFGATAAAGRGVSTGALSTMAGAVGGSAGGEPAPALPRLLLDAVTTRPAAATVAAVNRYANERRIHMGSLTVYPAEP
jgi:hypothetical protein